MTAEPAPVASALTDTFPPRLTGPLSLRLRLPAGEHIASVRARGRSFDRLARRDTLDLTGLRGRVELAVAISGGSVAGG